MLDMKKENLNTNNASAEESPDLFDDSNVTIHTMQDDINILKGNFSEPKVDASKSRNMNKYPNDVKVGNKNNQYFNPFLDSSSQASDDEFLPANVSSENMENRNLNLSESQLNYQNTGRKGGKIAWIIVSFIIVFVFLAGGYYLWSTRKIAENNVEAPVAENKIEETKEAEPIKEENSNTENKIEETKIVEKYSSEKANYLSINTTDPNPENLKISLLKVVEEVKAIPSKKPIEFIVTDEKNNPVSFSAFCVLSGIKLSGDLLKDLDDGFSLYLYSDSGNVKLGLATGAKEKEKIVPVIAKEELNLIQELMPLFLEDATMPKDKVVFNDNNYSGIAIRYFNLDRKGDFAIDYAFINEKLIFATSKNTMFAILDKINSGDK